MIKQEELQNNRIDYQFGDKKVVVVESHNYVLPVWAEYCSKLKKEYRLITLDYHMDTRPIFSQYAYQACNGDMAKVNEYTVQRKIYENYIIDEYSKLENQELKEDFMCKWIDCLTLVESMGDEYKEVYAQNMMRVCQDIIREEYEVLNLVWRNYFSLCVKYKCGLETK